MAQHAAQAARKGPADLRQHLDLRDPLHLVFDGVLDGDDLAGARVDIAQARVERRRLAATRRSGHKEDAVGFLDQRLEDFQIILRKPQLLETVEHLGRQDPDDDALPVGRGDKRDAQVERLVLRLDDGAAVLGQAVLDDVKVGHDLDAREDGV